MLTIKEQFNAAKFNCEKCNFMCSKKSNYEKHLRTQKHNNLTNLTEKKQKMPQHMCDNCNKEYKSREGLWYHKKKCLVKNTNNNKNETNETNKTNKTNETNETNENIIISELIHDNIDFKKMVLDVIKNNNELQKQNQDMHKQMVEMCKYSSYSNSVNNNTINSHNKTFNLQVFLNEDCKDAMNLSEFVNSLQLQLSDLDNMGKLGYTEGISKIIINEMNDLEQTKRPVHCSDIKRETLYVKDEDKWEKEQPDHPKLNKAIRKIEQKNFRLMGEWQAEHPTYMESTSEENNEFLKLISQTVNGTQDNINKVVKKIAKEVIIEK